MQKAVHRTADHLINRRRVPLSVINLATDLRDELDTKVLLSEMRQVSSIYDLLAVKSEPSNVANAVAWMGWESLNAGRTVDLRDEFINDDSIVTFPKMPLGCKTDDYICVQSKALQRSKLMALKKA